jgi:hypothetical protein
MNTKGSPGRSKKPLLSLGGSRIGDKWALLAKRIEEGLTKLEYAGNKGEDIVKEKNCH